MCRFKLQKAYNLLGPKSSGPAVRFVISHAKRVQARSRQQKNYKSTLLYLYMASVFTIPLVNTGLHQLLVIAGNSIRQALHSKGHNL